MRLLLALLVMLPLAAHAQTSSTSTAGSASGASSTNTVAPQQVLEVNSAANPAYTTTTVRNAPPIYSPNIQPTTPCTSVLSGGASFIGWGFSVGGSYEDKDCTRREYARSLQMAGQPDAALALLCVNAEVSAAAPQLCARVRYVMGRAADYVSSEPPVMPPAPVNPKPAAPPAPIVMQGTIGYGTDGRKYQYDGLNWIPFESPPAAAVTAPATVSPPVRSVIENQRLPPR